MAKVYKKTIVRYVDAAGKQVSKGTPGARKVALKSGKYYGTVPGSGKRVPLSPNKSVAEQMLAALIHQAGQEKIHGKDPFADHRDRPLREHLDDYIREMQAKGDDPRHVSIVAARMHALFAGCRFVFLADVTASAVVDYLAARRQQRPQLPLPAQD